VVNEANIDYVPASSMTADPVLEARAATPQIRQGLESWIARVTDALDAIDYLNLVTADGLWANVLGRVQDVGVR
jgi:capsid protein